MPATPDATDGVIDLRARARRAGTGTAWAYGGADLNANLLVLAAGEGVAAHVNDEVDVLIVGILGTGVVTVDNREHHIGAGEALVVPKGTRRAIHAVAEQFAYLTCHRRRAGLWPKGIIPPAEHGET